MLLPTNIPMTNNAVKIARVIMSNMIAFSKKNEEFTDLQLTFHIGDDRKWNDSESNEYYYHNVSELMKISKELLNNPKIINREGLNNFFNFNIKQILQTKNNYPDTEYLKDIPSKIDLIKMQKLR